jgi:hypothetical protein
VGCDVPLWCFIPPDVHEPAPDFRIWVQECFTSTVEPPYQLERVEYDIADAHQNLGAYRLEVREFDGDVPGDVIAEHPAGAGGTTGSQEFVLPQPVVIDTPQFCVGFAADSAGQYGGALGIGVDETAQLMDTSFFRMEGPQGCATADWADAIETDPTPRGNWCIRAAVSGL